MASAKRTPTPSSPPTTEDLSPRVSTDGGKTWKQSQIVLTESKKFSVSLTPKRAFTSHEPTPAHYLIEATAPEGSPTATFRAEAERILDEEFGQDWRELGHWQWSTHDTFEWRRAWRQHGVTVLKPTTIPDDIE